MSTKPTGAELFNSLATQAGFAKSASEVLQSLTAEEVEALSEEELGQLLAAVQEELGTEKTASETVAEMSDEELGAALAEMSPEEQQSLLETIQAEEAEQEKVAALMSGQYDDVALAGTVFGQAAAEALGSALPKVASEDDWEEIDPDQISVAALVQGLESGEIVEVDEDGVEKTAGSASKKVWDAIQRGGKWTGGKAKRWSGYENLAAAVQMGKARREYLKKLSPRKRKVYVASPESRKEKADIAKLIGKGLAPAAGVGALGLAAVPATRYIRRRKQNR